MILLQTADACADTKRGKSSQAGRYHLNNDFHEVLMNSHGNAGMSSLFHGKRLHMLSLSRTPFVLQNAKAVTFYFTNGSAL